MSEVLSDEVYEMLKVYVLAVPFNSSKDGFEMFRPYPLHQGNFILLEKDEPPVTITKDNYEDTILKLVDQVIEHAKEMPNSLSTLFICMSAPYRIQFLHIIRNLISKEELSDQFEWIWVQTEYPHQYPITMLLDLFKMSDPNILMNAEEQAKFDELPDEITIYRGLQVNKAKVRGLSWTLSLEKAKWFANRWKKASPVYKAVIDKKDVFAVFTGRSEEEIVVNPHCLKSVEEVPIELKPNAHS